MRICAIVIYITNTTHHQTAADSGGEETNDMSNLMDTYGNYEYLSALASAAMADGLTELAAEYAEMAAVLLAQHEGEQRIEKAAEKYAQEMAGNFQGELDNLEIDRYGSTRLGKEKRHAAAMARSNLYLAIRNAVYFE